MGFNFTDFHIPVDSFPPLATFPSASTGITLETWSQMKFSAQSVMGGTFNLYRFMLYWHMWGMDCQKPFWQRLMNGPIAWLAGCDDISGELLDIEWHWLIHLYILYTHTHTHTHTHAHAKIERMVPLLADLRSQPHAHDLEVPHHRLPAANLLAPNAKLFLWLVSFSNTWAC